MNKTKNKPKTEPKTERSTTKPEPKPAHGGARAGAGRKPDEFKQVQKLVRSEKAQDALDSWEFLVKLRDNPLVDMALRVQAAKYIISQVIGQPPQAVTVEGEMKLLVVSGEWKPA